MDSHTYQELRDRELARKRAYYKQNRDSERQKARERAKRRKENLAPEQISDLRKGHRLAQARYREKHRGTLNVRAWQYRLARKQRLANLADEEEYQRLMALTNDDNDNVSKE